MLSAKLIPKSPKKKFSLYLRAIKKKIIDINAKIDAKEDSNPLESKESVVAIMNRNISRKAR